MARVAVHAVVHISVHVGVIEVGCVVAAVAARAREHRVICRVRVASRANTVGAAMGGREERVIRRWQRRLQPSSRVVARYTRRGPACRCVVGVRGPRVVLGVARVAISRRTDKYVVDVAQGAGNRGVRARQRERRVVVVEHGACPVRHRVARVAGGREARRGVSWVGGSVVIRLVASDARGRQRPVVCTGAGVATHACHGGVEASQRERRSGVVKG